MNKVISLANVTKSFKVKNYKTDEFINVGCFNINLSLQPGDVFGFIGPNGAGKTTVIRQLIGFIKSDAGVGTILGHDIWLNSKDIMAVTGYLPAEPFLPDFLTGLQYLKTVASIRKNVDWNYVEKLIDYFDFRVNTKIKKMSKGMKQKVAIVATFMHQPKVLIFDEPTTGLDPLIQEKFKQLVQKTASNGTTVFISSHIFGEIDELCNKVAIIKNGKIVIQVTMDEVRNSGNKIFELKFNHKNDYEALLTKEWEILTKNPAAQFVKVSVTKEQIASFSAAIKKYDLAVINQKDMTTRDYFLKFYSDEVNFND